MEKLLNVVVITYDRFNYLKLLLKSIENQTFKRFNLYIINNGSKDNTDKFLKGYKELEFTYIRNEINSKNVFNQAISFNGLKYLSILHDDDILKPNFFKSNIEILERDKFINLISSRVNLIGPKNESLKKIKPIIFKSKTWTKNEYIKTYLIRGNILNFPTIIYRSKILLDIELNVDIIGPAADLYLIFLLNKKAGKIHLNKNSEFYYRIHQLQDSQLNKIHSEFTLREHLINLFKNKKYLSAYKNASLGFILNILIYEKLTKKIDKLTFKHHYDELKNLGLKFNFYSVYWLLFSILRFLKKSI